MTLKTNNDLAAMVVSLTFFLFCIVNAFLLNRNKKLCFILGGIGFFILTVSFFIDYMKKK
jgi:hypothetical protein